MPNTILCARCHQSKPEDAFPYWQRNRPSPYCTPCVEAENEEAFGEAARQRREAAQAARHEAPPAPVEVPGRRGRRRPRLVGPMPVELEPQADAPALPHAWEEVPPMVIPARRPSTPEAIEPQERDPVAHLVDEEKAAAPPALADERPAPVDRYQAMGRTRTPAKSDAARENGRRGGRPRKWGREALALAGEWILERLEKDPPELYDIRQDLVGLTEALKAGKIR